MNLDAYNAYLTEQQTKKVELNAFLSNKTMLVGRITNFDDKCIILDKCMIFHDQIISIVPQKK